MFYSDLNLMILSIYVYIPMPFVNSRPLETLFRVSQICLRLFTYCNFVKGAICRVIFLRNYSEIPSKINPSQRIFLSFSFQDS